MRAGVSSGFSASVLECRYVHPSDAAFPTLIHNCPHTVDGTGPDDCPVRVSTPFLRSWQIAALVGGSKQMVLRRLQLLFHHGYLERPRSQIEYYQPGGSHAFVYGLSDRGAELLRSEAQRARSSSNECSPRTLSGLRMFMNVSLA